MHATVPLNLTLVLILFSLGVLDATSADELKREKRAVTCESKYQDDVITTGHTACLEPSAMLDTNNKGVSETDKQTILDVHNTARRDVSPTATNMMLMTWDDEIANTAQRWAEKCEVNPLTHDENYKRYAFGRFSVGQNLASGYADWTGAMKGWEDEKLIYDYATDTNPSSKVIGHYTQMVWATSSKVGCGYALCGSTHYYVCNYGPAGNSMGDQPYVSGTTCADCQGNCNNGLCDCGDKVCLNGGTMDLATCTCSCKSGLAFLEAPTCGLNCDLNQEATWCNQYGADKCELFTNVPQECPLMCNWCPSAAHSPPSSTPAPSTPSPSTPSTTTPNPTQGGTNEPETTTSAGAAVVSNIVLTVFLIWALVFAK